MLKTLLVSPPFYSLRGLVPDPATHLGLMYLAAYLRQNQYDSKILIADIWAGLKPVYFVSMRKYTKNWGDYPKNLKQIESHVVWRNIRNIVREYGPDIVGITTTTPIIDSALVVAKIVKSFNPETKVVFGGPHATFLPEETLSSGKVDFVVRGEGEIPLLELVKTVGSKEQNFASIPGLSYRQANGSFVHNPLPPLFPKLDALPYPARDLILSPGQHKQVSHSITATRGCGHRCAFCADRNFWRKQRHRSVGNVVDEIESILTEYPETKSIYFNDGALTFNLRYLKKLCAEIVRRNISVDFYGGARFDAIDSDVLLTMKKTGFKALYLGAESGDPEMLLRMKKKTTPDEIITKTEMIKLSGIQSLVAILIGAPGETKQSLDNTVSLLNKLPADSFDVNCYVPLPGCPWYEDMPEHLKRNLDWTKYGLKGGYPYLFQVEGKTHLNHYVDEIYKIADRRLMKTMARYVTLEAVSKFRNLLGNSKRSLRKK